MKTSSSSSTQNASFVDEEGRELFEHQRFQVEKAQRPMRLDRYIAQTFARCTRSRAKKGLEDGFFRLNGNRSKPATQVRPGDIVTLSLPTPMLPEAGPESLPLDILYEDEHILVINKSSGMVCHPTVSHRTGTLFQGVLGHLGYTHSRKDADPEKPWPGLVHRLDRETSGVMVLGKHQEAVTHLSQQFFHRTIERRYQAIAWGEVLPQTLDTPLDGKRAVTHVAVIKPLHLATFVECRLETGRTHQIRLHLSGVGHPLWADSMYNGGWKQQRPGDESPLKEVLLRTALHARSLAFTHPAREERLSFVVEAPEDLQRLLTELQR
jgi:23S rRNA pseudouridine1911/1915/1917 synthase